MEENNNIEFVELEDTGKTVVDNVPAKESKAKAVFKKAWKIAAIGAGGVLALFAAGKIGENRGRKNALETLDGYEVKVSSGSDEPSEEEVNE